MSANSSGQPRLAGNFPALEKGPSLDPEAMEFSSDEATQTSPQSPHPAQRSRLSADQGMRRGARAPPGFVLFGIHGNRKKKHQKNEAVRISSALVMYNASHVCSAFWEESGWENRALGPFRDPTTGILSTPPPIRKARLSRLVR